MKYILTFDIGTTAVKACLFDERLRLAACSNEEYALLTAEDGTIELEPCRYWEAVKAGAKAAIEKAEIDPADVSAVSVTTQGETLIPVDENGDPLRNAIVWLDQRAEKEAAELAEKFPADVFYRKTGLPELNGYTPIAKVMWIRNNEPEIYRKTDCFLLLEDYIFFKLTGKRVTEKSLATSTGWYTFDGDGYYREILEAAGLDIGKFPPMLESGEIIPGGLLPEVRKELGLSDSVAAVTGAMDQTAGALAMGNVKPGRVTETTGTALVIGATLPSFDPAAEPKVTVYRHYKKDLYLMMPICMTAGMFLKWFRDEFCAEEKETAEKRGISSYQIIDEEVESIPAGSGGLVALPYLTGSLQPVQDSKARGIFFGFGLEHKRPHFLRAVFESVAFMLRENIELIEKAGRLHVSSIISLGGGASSPVWCRIKADTLGQTICVPEVTESTSCGAAVLAAVAIGWYADAEAAAEAASGKMSFYEPDPSEAKEYDKAYAKYKALYEHTRTLF